MKRMIKNFIGTIFCIFGVAAIVLSIMLNVILIKDHMRNRELKENTKSINAFKHTISWVSDDKKEEEDEMVTWLDNLIDEMEAKFN